MKSTLHKTAAMGLLLGVGVALGVTFTARAQEQKLGYQDTPLIPGTKWHVHDGLRPQPRVVAPGMAGTLDKPGTPPSDAVILFDGTDLSKWQANGKPAKWKVENGSMQIASKTGSLATKEPIGDCQLHIEWAVPNPGMGSGQQRSNSGVLFFGRYEIQVLDSYESKTYPDGQASAIYGSYPPLVNAVRKSGEWQVYDIIFTAPRFEGEKLVKPGYFTVMVNGVLVHNHAEILGTSNHRAAPNYTPHPPKGALVLQDHGDPGETVRYRNIWYRELKGYDEL